MQHRFSAYYETLPETAKKGMSRNYIVTALSGK